MVGRPLLHKWLRLVIGVALLLMAIAVLAWPATFRGGGLVGGLICEFLGAYGLAALFVASGTICLVSVGLGKIKR